MKKLPKAAFWVPAVHARGGGAPDKARRIQERVPRTGQVNVLYKNIIFDLGGVVVDFDPREFLVDHFMNERVEDQLYDITFGSEEWLQMDAGLLTREEGDRIMREKARLRRSFEVGVILDDWYDMLRTKDDTVQLIKRLKKRDTACFTFLISWDVLEMLQQRKIRQLFDGGVASR